MFFAGFGCITSIGINAEMTMSSIRAGISGYKKSNFLCSDSSPAVMSHITDDLFLMFSVNTEYMGGYSAKMDRSSKMMLYALNDLQEQVTLDDKVPLIWLQEEPHPSREPIATEFVKDQLEYYEAPVDVKQFYTISMGRASGIAALEKAQHLLHQAGHDYVLIGGVECPFHSPWLEQLDKRKRLKKNESKDAFAPGEAASFLLLSRTPELAINRDNQTLKVCLPGITESPAHWYNDEPNTAEALHLAMSQAITHFTSSIGDDQVKIDQIVSSMNGENFWGKEYGVAITRLNNHFVDEYVLHHPFEYTGDLGAVSGTFFLGFAAEQIFNQHCQRSLIYTSSDNQWRSAVCIAQV